MLLWPDPKTDFLLDRVNEKWGDWTLFFGRDYSGGSATQMIDKLNRMPYCHVETLGERYRPVLSKASFAIVSGGYNTLTDLMWSQTAGVVCKRSMIDNEQGIHVNHLCKANNGVFEPLPEEKVTAANLAMSIKNILNCKAYFLKAIITGSEVTAKRIGNILKIKK